MSKVRATAKVCAMNGCNKLRVLGPYCESHKHIFIEAAANPARTNIGLTGPYYYRGTFDGKGNCLVFVTYTDNGDKHVPLEPRHDLRNHSPDGFAWGYGGSGPAQLALAIMAHYCGNNDDQAMRLYQKFKSKVIARFPQKEEWKLTPKEIEEALGEIANPFDLGVALDEML